MTIFCFVGALTYLIETFSRPCDKQQCDFLNGTDDHLVLIRCSRKVLGATEKVPKQQKLKIKKSEVWWWIRIVFETASSSYVDVAQHEQSRCPTTVSSTKPNRGLFKGRQNKIDFILFSSLGVIHHNIL